MSGKTVALFKHIINGGQVTHQGITLSMKPDRGLCHMWEGEVIQQDLSVSRFIDLANRLPEHVVISAMKKKHKII